jgi:hypothetical protein
MEVGRIRWSDSAGLKLQWSGAVTSVQPRIRLLRSFDQRSHSYLGYVLRVRGNIAGKVGECSVAIGRAAQAKHAFRAGDRVSGQSERVADERMEPAQLYKTCRLKVLARADSTETDPPPWIGTPPVLAIYRQRGHRRLASRTYQLKCRACIWGCRMPVEMIVDQWNPHQKRYRFETFCYGPKSCPVYRAGPTRKVPGRRGMVWEEEDWVDEDATSHRGIDE